MCQNKASGTEAFCGEPQQAGVHGRALRRNGKPCLSSRELLGESQELLIEHDGYCYSLRITKQNKLILTK
ncbi:Hypothetical protein HDN1F_26020 [gamma proteobacterium HdN1]|nr:Hypothetical protein HDN1F_26020 [gamma proteobacterium HdN1]